MSTKHNVRHCTPRERWAGLLRHVVIFLFVNAGLIMLNLSRHPEKHWFIWPLLGWGAGIILHAIIVLYRNQFDRPG